MDECPVCDSSDILSDDVLSFYTPSGALDYQSDAWRCKTCGSEWWEKPDGSLVMTRRGKNPEQEDEPGG